MEIWCGASAIMNSVLFVLDIANLLQLPRHGKISYMEQLVRSDQGQRS